MPIHSTIWMTNSNLFGAISEIRGFINIGVIEDNMTMQSTVVNEEGERL